jgi:hypothetical protein
MRGKPDPLPEEKPILQRALFIFFGALTLAFLWAQVRDLKDIVGDVTYLKNALFYPLFYFVYLRCRMDEKTTRLLIILVMIVAAVAGLEAIREGIDYGFGKYNPFRRASGPFGEDWHQANRAGVFYAMFMPMFTALALFLKKRKLWRLAAIAGMGLMAGGALFTYSRQAYFIAIFSVALLLIRKSIVLSVVIGVVLVSAVGYLPDSVTQRVDETKQADPNGSGEEVDASTASRFEIWAGAMEMLAHNPIGVGLNRFKDNIGNYSSHKHMDAHNFYVLTLAECGPLGLAALLYLFWTLLFGLASFLRKHTPPDDHETRALTIGFTVCTIAMALGGIYGSPTLEGTVMAPYWALCGLLERYIRFKMANSAAGGQAPGEPRTTTLTVAERFPLAAYLDGKR